MAAMASSVDRASIRTSGPNVLTQERVAGKTNEIPTLPELLEPLDLDGVVVIADAMHTRWPPPSGSPS